LQESRGIISALAESSNEKIANAGINLDRGATIDEADPLEHAGDTGRGQVLVEILERPAGLRSRCRGRLNCSRGGRAAF
jgi:hypothetical protein